MNSKIFVISGPSGVGKNAILDKLLKKFSNSSRILNSTSRKPRKGEKDLHDYRFLSIGEFIKLFEGNKFLETNQFHGDCYGTLSSDFEEAKEKGNILFWILDVRGVKTIQKKNMKDIVYIFITIKDSKDLEKRIMERESIPENIKERIGHSKWEISQNNIYDHVVENEHGEIDKTVTEIEEIIKKEV